MEKWTVLNIDISKILAARAHLRMLKVDGLHLLLTVELEKEAYEKLKKDPTWIQKMTDKAQEKAVAGVVRLVKLIELQDKRAVMFGGKVTDIFTKDVDAAARKEMEQVGKEMATEIDHLFEEYKHGQKELLKFRIKSGTKVTMNGIVIVGAVAVAGATHGALAPASIVAIARGGIVIAQECVKLASTADTAAIYIQGELKALAVIMSTNMKNASTAKIVKQSMKEALLGTASGVLGLEIPNFKNCAGHIEVHKVDIAKLDAESHELSKSIEKVMAAATQSVAEDKKAKAKVTMKSPKGQKTTVDRTKAEAALHSLLEGTIKVNEAVARANARQKKFEEALHAMTEGVPEWVGLVQTAVTIVVDVGLAVGGATTAIEQGLGALIAFEVDVAAELIDRS